MAEVGRWKPYTQRQGQLLPAFVEGALDPGDTVFSSTTRSIALPSRRCCAGSGISCGALQPAAAARIRNRVRLTHAGEAAPPARGAE
jgi:hypothetical protein